nr:30S ribosomal protein S1 [Staphylococcus aureus]
MTEEFNESMINDIKEGDKVTGEVQQVEDKQVVVHINGGKFNGLFLLVNYLRIIDKVKVKEGQVKICHLKLIDKKMKQLTLSRRQLKLRSLYYLQEKLDNNEIIEAKVTEVVKGGLVVDVGQRGFVPASLISTDFIEDFSVFDGQTIRIKVEELDPENNRVILSRKAVEQEENDAKKDQLLQSLNEGDVIDGKVARLTQFGAFIDIGGVDGLVHVSELSHEHVQTPEEVVSIGQDVKVKIKSIDRDTERISLSIKDTLPTPFENIKGQFHENDVIEGVVVRLANFGAFVEIAPGVQGLVHISEIAHKHIGTPGEVLEPGQQVNVKILGIDEENERVSLSIKATLPNEDVVESDPSTTKVYLESEEEDNPTIGDMIGDKLKNLKL